MKFRKKKIESNFERLSNS